MPATVQAAIEARIDRLNTPAKRTLNAASVIGARFGAELLAALGIDAVLDELLSAELIDQVRFTPSAEYAFRHPLIRAVAYESQLKSDRAQWHRRLATAIQEREPGSVEENAALIAEHLEAAGDLPAAYGWHMRAATWSTNRDVAAARLSWERARKIADALPADDPDQAVDAHRPAHHVVCHRLQPERSMETAGAASRSCGSCAARPGTRSSLAIGMSGLVTELLYPDRSREASRLASEQMALLESIGDPTLTMGLAFIASTPTGWMPASSARSCGGRRPSSTWPTVTRQGRRLRFRDHRWRSRLTCRGVARWWLGRPGWRDDLRHGVAMARSSDPATYAVVVAWTYGLGDILYGVLRADDARCARSRRRYRSPNDPVTISRWPGPEFALGVALRASGHRGRPSTAGRSSWCEVRDAFLRGVIPAWMPFVELYVGAGEGPAWRSR